MRDVTLYLASASPRRSQILTQLDIAHTVLQVPAPPGEDEPILLGESPETYVMRTARDKLDRAGAWLSDPSGLAMILAADTTVALEGEILGKPQDTDDARRILSLLSGRTHEVLTAVSLGWAEQSWHALSRNLVRFAPLSEREIDHYCASGEPMGKAGAYGIQGRAATFVEHISGSHSGIMGLPAFETARLLDQARQHTPAST